MVERRSRFEYEDLLACGRGELFVQLSTLAATMRRVLEGRATATQEQEFYNSDCGLPHLPVGGYISPDALDACIDPGYTFYPSVEGCVMGVDVGKRLHVTVALPEGSVLRLTQADAVHAFTELDGFMHRYGVTCCVIDANPETRLAQEFADRWPGRVFLAYYPNFTGGSRPDLLTIDEAAHVVRIVRTAALDLAQSVVLGRQIILPRNARELGGAVNQAGVGEFYQQMGSPIRVVEDDTRGNPVASFAANGADHFSHSFAYMLSAFVTLQRLPRRQVVSMAEDLDLDSYSIDSRYGLQDIAGLGY